MHYGREQYIYDAVKKHANSDACLLWLFATNGHGYGRVTVKGRQYLVTRLTYAKFIGPLGSNDDVLHTCDNPPCFNPKHLFKGNAEINAQDAVRKGRLKPSFIHGEEHGCAKLTESAVLAIRALCVNRTLTYRAIGRKFGISRPWVKKIADRAVWRHLPE